MPIRYDSVLVGALAGELARNLVGRRLEELHFEPESRQVSAVFTGGEQLVWMLHPAAGQVLLRPGALDRRARRARGRGVLRSAAHVTEVTAGPDERRIEIQLAPLDRTSGDLPLPACREPDVLVFELHTNQWNSLLVSEGVIRAVAWPRRAGDRRLYPGSEYRPPEGGRLWSTSRPGTGEWESWWEAQESGERARAMLRDVSWVSRLNVDYVLGSDLVTGQDAGSALGRLETLRTAGRGTTPADAGADAWSLVRGDSMQPYPVSLDEPDAEPSGSLLSAMAETAKREGVGPSPNASGTDRSDEIEQLEAALQQREARARKRCTALERQLEQGNASAALRSAGQLLLMNKDRVRRGESEAVVEDFDGSERRIPLDPARDMIANAEDYFQRARRRERAERELPARIAAARARLAALENAVSTLAATGPTEELWQIAGGRAVADPAARGSGKTGAPLPYRRLLSSGGLEIRVGRSARSNDALTFRHSAPDDIWLHARQAAGAHVILRWGNREQNPPEADLRDAALAAADFSEARSSGLVAVDWTRRKYVRKPRKAAAGAVVPDRVKTLFVEPDPDRIRQMKEAGPDAP
jgi:predicted ribosome quality control (RQC) complex YloA/Tae2 family protein